MKLRNAYPRKKKLEQLEQLERRRVQILNNKY
jgi:hypothetical protein